MTKGLGSKKQQSWKKKITGKTCRRFLILFQLLLWAILVVFTQTTQLPACDKGLIWYSMYSITNCIDIYLSINGMFI